MVPSGFPFSKSEEELFFRKWYDFNYSYGKHKEVLNRIVSSKDPYHVLKSADLLCVNIDLGLDTQALQVETQRLMETLPKMPADSGGLGTSKGWSRVILRGNTAHKTLREMENDINKPIVFERSTAPYLYDLLEEKSFPDSLSFFSVIGPHGCVGLHTDVRYKGFERGLHKLRIPIFYNKECYFVLENFGVVPLNRGETCMFDFTHPHGVYNFSTTESKVDLSLGLEYKKNKDWLDQAAYQAALKIIRTI